MPDAATHYPALLRCGQCGRTLPANRVELAGYARTGLPTCCGQEMDLYILAERPKPGDTQVVALPVPLPGSHEDTAIISPPQPRKPQG